MENDRFAMSSSTYNFFKWVALVLLPALGAAYFSLGQIWDYPAIEQVVGTITVVDTLLGVVLNKSSRDYADSPDNLVGAKSVGKIIVQQDPEAVVEGMRFEAYEDPFILTDSRQVVFDVRREQRL